MPYQAEALEEGERRRNKFVTFTATPGSLPTFMYANRVLIELGHYRNLTMIIRHEGKRGRHIIEAFICGEAEPVLLHPGGADDLINFEDFCHELARGGFKAVAVVTALACSITTYRCTISPKT